MNIVIGNASVYSICCLPCSSFPARELHDVSQKQLLKQVPNPGLREFLVAQPFLDLLGKNVLNSGNVCYHSVQNLLPSALLFKIIKIIIHKTIILPVVLYSCETWSLALTEEHGLRVFENRVLRKNLDRREMK
jgi:hypothetical protein